MGGRQNLSLLCKSIPRFMPASTALPIWNIHADILRALQGPRDAHRFERIIAFADTGCIEEGNRKAAQIGPQL